MGNKKGSGQIRMFRSLITLLLIGLAVHILLPQIATFEHSLQVVKGMALWALVLAVAAQVLSYLGSGYLLQGIAALTGQPPSTLRGMMITAASYSVGLVAGGMVGAAAATSLWMRASGVSAESAVLAGWLPGLLDDIILILLALLGLLFLLIAHSLTTFQVISFVTVLILLSPIIAVTYWATRHRSNLTTVVLRVMKSWASLRRRPYNPDPIEQTVNRFLKALDLFITGGWRGPIVGASLTIVFDMATLYFIFVAAGYAIKPGILLVGYGLPLLFGKAPLLPGGVGIVEATMAALYNGLGVPDATTVVVILTYRFLSFWLPLLLGFPMIPYLQRKACDLSPEGMSLAPSAQRVQPDTIPPHRRTPGGEP